MEFRLLGPLEVLDDDGVPVPLGGPRPRALLARLLLAPNAAVSTDRLIDGIWGESPPASAQNALQVHVHTLRGAIGADRIVTRPPGYLVRVDPDERDVDRFERLVAAGELHDALALWRGPAIADVLHEPFAQAEAARLDEARLAALETRVELDLAEGRHATITSELESLVLAHPHRERLRAQQMLALYRSDRQADALAAYRDTRAALDELGLEPSPSLRALEQQILRHDPALTDPASSAPAATAATSMVGRDRELAAVTALLRRDDVRLVTLTGPGGTGKTRLATEIVANAERARFVDLSSLLDPNLVLSTVAAALDLGDVSGRELEAIRASLGDDPPLLVLDNLEHLSEAFAAVAELIAAAPMLKILATSRVPLRIAPEHEYRVEPLALPAAGATTKADATSDAVRLYVARAAEAVPDFELTDANAANVTRICRALDGLPLAIELAAARIRVLGVDGTAKRLGEALVLLRRNAPDRPERQRSLRATIDWSYRLLDEPTRHVLRSLSVFAGGATIDAVESVARSGVDVPTTIETLLDAGLLTIDTGTHDRPRVRLLETIREFAAEQLEAEGERDVALARHLAHVVEVVEASEARLRTESMVAVFDELELERDNVRAALVVAAQDPHSAQQLRIVTGLRVFLNTRGPADEARRMAAEALERRRSAPVGLQGRILISAGIHACDDDDGERALLLLDEARPLLDEAGDVRGVALADANAAVALGRLGRNEEARARTELAALGFRAVGAAGAESQALTNLAHYDLQAGELEAARARLVQALEVQERTGHAEARAFTLAMLGYVAEQEGDFNEAARCLRRTLEAIAELRHDQFLAYALLFAADLETRAPQLERAATLLGASDGAFARAALVAEGDEADRGERVAALVRDELGDDVFAAARADGATLDLDESIELALRTQAAR